MSSVEDWIEEKLDEGADRDALKQVLRDKGHDPDKVDRIAEEPSLRSPELNISGEMKDESEQQGLRGDESTSGNSSFNLRNLVVALVLFVISLVVGLFISGTVSL